MDYRGHNNPMFLPEVVGQPASVNTFNSNGCQCAGLPRVERGQDLNPSLSFQAAGPAVFQIPQSSRFALDTDAFVKGQSLGNRVVICRRMSSDLLELANVVILLFIGGHQRPQSLDLGLSDEQKTGAVRSQQPFMQAGAIVVAVKIREFERKMRKRMSAIDDDLYSALSSQLADALDRKDLAGQVGYMANLNDSGLWRD